MIEKFYTRTLCLLYEKQGYYESAKEGLRALLAEDPENSLYQEDIDRIEGYEKNTSAREITALFTEWVTLLRHAKSRGLV